MIDFITSSTSLIITILVFLLIFGILIVLHELGHFWAARAAKVQVQEFGFGMPPKVWGKKTKATLSKNTSNERTEEMEWTINAIPFGGFVRMLGEHEDSGNPYAFGNRPLFWRMLVIWGGVIMNFLLGWALLTIALGIGIDPIPSSAKEYKTFVDQGLLEEKTGFFIYSFPSNTPTDTLQKGDRVVSIDKDTDIINQDFATNILIERFNTESKTFQTHEITFPQPISLFPSSLSIKEVRENGPSDIAGIQTGDIIKRVNGVPFRTSQELYTLIKESLSENSEISFLLMRENEEYSTSVFADHNGTIGISWEYPEKENHINLVYEQSAFAVQDLKYPWIETPVEGLKYSWTMIQRSFDALKGMIGQITSSFTLPEAIGGPVAIAHHTDTLLKYGDIMKLIVFTAMISLSLAVLNIMPFPGLDGGRFVFLVIEGILIIKAWFFRTILKVHTPLSPKVPPSVEGWVNTIGFLMLMGLLLWITGNDILKIFF